MDKLENLRHSCAHLLAAAVLNLWPDTKRAIGPPIEGGFYYDFEFSETISELNLPKIEKKMQQILQTWKKFEHKEVSAQEAKKLFKDNPYKLGLIDEFSKQGQKLTIYKSGDYIDLCRGGHVESPSKELQHFKLLKLAGAYWRGSEKNKMLTRIYGTVFPTKKELDDYLNMLGEAKKRDHRVLGRELDLFSFQEEAPGMVFLHPKGTIVWDSLIDYWKELHYKENYKIVKTPIILNNKLWKRSGHWDHYKENMYFVKVDKEDFAVKPMNCPGAVLVYKSSMHSYRELPLKLAEIGLVHRHELSGVLSGLFRVRSFHQDDAHIFCEEDQIEQEVLSLMKLFDKIYKQFNLSYKVELSTRPEKAMGSVELWNKAERALESAMKKAKMEYKVNPGDGAFYGPKIDFHIKDAIGRTWQCGTIQLDFQMPEKFELSYEGKDGKKHKPVMLHRVVYGSLERFLGVLIEHYAGKFPTWLAPVQVVLMTVADRHAEYAKKLKEELEKNNIRVELDDRSESIGKKVRDNQLERIPYMITIGDKEIETDNLAIRTRDNKVITIKKQEFIGKLLGEIKNKDVN